MCCISRPPRARRMANPGQSRRGDGVILGKAAETEQRTEKAAHLAGEVEEGARTPGHVGLGIRPWPWPSVPPLAATLLLALREHTDRSLDRSLPHSRDEWPGLRCLTRALLQFGVSRREGTSGFGANKGPQRSTSRIKNLRANVRERHQPRPAHCLCMCQYHGFSVVSETGD